MNDVVLGNDADVFAEFSIGHGFEVVFIESHLPFVGLHDARKDFHEGGFPRPTWPQNDDKFEGADGEGDIIEDGSRSSGDSKILTKKHREVLVKSIRSHGPVETKYLLDEPSTPKIFRRKPDFIRVTELTEGGSAAILTRSVYCA